MSESDVNTLLVAIAEVKAELRALRNDNARGDAIHLDHETRIRTLEATRSESRGVVKLLTAGGAVGVALAGLAALALRSLGV